MTRWQGRRKRGKKFKERYKKTQNGDIERVKETTTDINTKKEKRN